MNIIVAYDRNKLIGNNGRLPWNIPEELQIYKSFTWEEAILMGRTTYEALEYKPLPNRLNIVLTRRPTTNTDEVIYVNSLDEAFNLCKKKGLKLFISGGESVYRLALPHSKKLIITKIDREYSGDTYFPEFDESLYDISLNYESKGEIPFKNYIYTLKGEH